MQLAQVVVTCRPWDGYGNLPFLLCVDCSGGGGLYSDDGPPTFPSHNLRSAGELALARGHPARATLTRELTAEDARRAPELERTPCSRLTAPPSPRSGTGLTAQRGPSATLVLTREQAQRFAIIRAREALAAFANVTPKDRPLPAELLAAYEALDTLDAALVQGFGETEEEVS